MSEDNKQLEEHLDNQVQNSQKPESLIEENANHRNSYSNQPFNDSVSSTTKETATTAEQIPGDSQLNETSLQIGEIVAALATLLQGNQRGSELLSQLQQIIGSLVEHHQMLLQANESFSEQLEEQNQQLETTKRRYVGLAAEFDNFRKRTQREKEDLEKQVKRKTLNELLEVVDNFERARVQIKPTNDGEMEIHKSYQGVYNNLVKGLKRLGVSAMRPEGEPFDPMYHEAIYREPTNEYPEGTVIEQLVRGYLLDDQILRHAMVKVAAPPEPESDQSEPTPEAISDAQ
ncbi:nucleotide exchange factor GrpE [Gloeothece verrucosa]|uniref:Protein GrpE n=1 Tax=Gloeothece verrucosa (strain PCC 7822) TaxID=497965 RepID=E0U9J0_GLOV7|nr:nucleotide exchange factor GrpE [Gloeothece verrucosa]ADN13791.1 GrpE protein [Gloeothece verrucosa PCC 7822]